MLTNDDLVRLYNPKSSGHINEDHAARLRSVAAGVWDEAAEVVRAEPFLDEDFVETANPYLSAE